MGDLRAVTARLVLTAGLLALVACSEGPPFFIRGTASLPPCNEAPAFDVDGSQWVNSGPVTILTGGCPGTQPSDVFQSCGLTWDMTQDGSEIQMLVDNEYIVLGRLCETTLYLEGGFWLPVEDDGVCTYADDSAEEVGIQEGGSSLVLTEEQGQLIGTGALRVQGRCDATYDMTLTRFN